MSHDLVHCVLALARSQQDLLTCWNASLSAQDRQVHLNQVLLDNWEMLNERLNELNMFACKLDQT